MNKKNKNRKIFVIDTCVLLYDKCSIHSFPRNDVVIPLVVLDELDRFKDSEGIVGENARYVNRYLDDLRVIGSLHKGVCLENKQTIRVEINHDEISVPGLSMSSSDNKIISTTLYLMKKNPNKNVRLVTKDINFRVKCDALNIVSDDYNKDKISTKEEGLFKGYLDIDIEDPSIIDDGHKNGFIEIEKIDFKDSLYPNQFICLKSGSQSFLGCFQKGIIKKILTEDKLSLDYTGVRSRNREQLYALNLLKSEDIPLVSLTGIAGSGKTFLTIMSALEGIGSGKYERIVISRNLQPVGRDIGYLPGSVDDKMLPWISPIIDNFRQGLKDKDLTFFSMMKEKGQIEIAPLSFMRGRTFSNTFLILDEAQNASIHELKTVITRIGENSKIVILGDIEQIDTPYIDTMSNGLTIISEKFKNEDIAGHVTFKKGERSKLATLASKLI